MTHHAPNTLASATAPTGKLLPLLAGLPAIGASKAPCTAYTWCTETGDHFEHTGRLVFASCEDAYGNPVLPVNLIEWGKGVKVGLLDLDLTPAEARGKLAELRAHLDLVEALVDTAEAGQ